MKGYYLKENLPVTVTEDTLVGCRRCRNTWREPREIHSNFRVNGPQYCYDVCDKCKTDKDQVRE